MQVNNQPVFNQGLVRNDRKGQQALNANAPSNDKVMDLTNSTQAESELNTKDTQFIRVQSKGEDVFLDISKMPKEQKDALIAELKHQVSGAVKFGDFNPKEFFQLFGNNHLKIGTSTPQGPTAKIQTSEAVLNKSLTGGNPQQQQIFGLMNGGEKALDKADASQKVGDQNKPAAWYNGFQISGDPEAGYDVSTYTSDLDKSGQNYDLNTQGYKGKTGIDAYKSMLRDDFNFNGAVSAIYKSARDELGTTAPPDQIKAKAEDLFVESVVRKFSPKHPNLSDDQLKTLATQVWSYATTGADKNGHIDIGEMQGMLKQIDPEMVKSGSNNSYSQYGKFTVSDGNGHSFTLPKGDPYHGRGTILQTRHLMESLKPDAPIRLSFATPPPELQGYSNTLLLADNSASMGSHMQHLAGVIKAGGIEGSLNVGTYIDKDKPMIWSNADGNSSSKAVKFNSDQAEALLTKQGNAHVDYTKGLNSNSDLKAIAAEEKALQGKIDEDKKRVENLGKYIAANPDHPNIENYKAGKEKAEARIADNEKALEAKKAEYLQTAQKGLDVAPGSAFIYGQESMNESGIIAGISALESQPNAPAGAGPNSNQLILFTDETDASTPEDLKKLQDLAQQKGYDVKVVFTAKDSFQIVNVNQISATQSQQSRTTANSVDYALDWKKIAARQQAQAYQWAQTGI